MLEDAVEEVPEGVWEGVSGALDKAAGKKKVAPVFWWRMLGGVTAAAAAVALGVFLWPDRKGDFSPVEKPDAAPVAVVVPATPDNIVSAPSTTPLIHENGQKSGRPADSSMKNAIFMDNTAQTVPSSIKSAENMDETPEIIDSSKKSAENMDETPETVELSIKSAESLDGGEATSKTEDLQEQKETVPQQVNAPDFTEGIAIGPDRIRRAGQVSLSFSGNAFATGRPSTETPGVVRMGAQARFRAPKATGVTPVSKEAKYGMPFTVGIGAKYYVIPRLAIGTGVNYSLLVRSFVGTYNEVSTTVEDGVEHSALVRSVTSDVFNDQHYIGVPLTLFYDYVQTDRVRAYVRADGMIEKNVHCHYRFHSASEPMSYVEKVKGVQWSAGAGLGIEVRLGKHVGIYADPGVRYYFKGNQPASLRTVQPLMVDINAGVRFNIN